MYVQSYKELIVWQKSFELVKVVYRITTELPQSEQYGLTSQMRRAVVSVPSNIAEGYKRQGLGEYIHFLTIADASLAELETQLLLSASLFPQINFQDTQSLLTEVQKMLIVMIKKLQEKQKNTKR